MDLDKLDPIYFANEKNLDKELFYPIFKLATTCRCMTGYFTSGALSELSQSLAHFLSYDGRNLQFLVSPNLEITDIRAIRSAIDADENLLPLLFPGFDLSVDTLKTRAVEALSYLVATKKLEMRLALQDDGLFHTKCWLFDTDKGPIAVHGSGNATKSGLSINFEQLTVSRAWVSEESAVVVKKLSDRFSLIWDDDYDHLKTFVLNKRTIDCLSDIYQTLRQANKTSIDLLKELNESFQEDGSLEKKHSQSLKIPRWLNYTSGDFAHQEKAVNAWSSNRGRGIFSIATGGGKTLTALVAATLTSTREHKLFVVVAVPTKALLRQWSDDVSGFDVRPINTLGMGRDKVVHEINEAIRRIKFNNSESEVLIITHDAVKNNTYTNLFKKASKSMPLMLIGDEVHNLGSVGFQESAIQEFKYRLGLSATVERQFDDAGTEFLLTYFGPIVFEYPLSEAIGVCLVPYDYYVHKVLFDAEEEEEWTDLTYEIRKVSYASEMSDGESVKERWKLLCLKRRRLVEAAKGKVEVMAKVIPADKKDIRRTLIFCTDKSPGQLTAVNKLLNERGIIFHQVTADETSNKTKLIRIIDSFASEEYQVLTSKRVLDEGFNIPQTEVAYLLASNTVLRQWVQRLGRVLRKSPQTGKEKAEIHDFVVFPLISDGQMDSDLKSLMLGELKRVQYFDGLSRNGLESGGAADIVAEMLGMVGSI